MKIYINEEKKSIYCIWPDATRIDMRIWHKEEEIRKWFRDNEMIVNMVHHYNIGNDDEIMDGFVIKFYNIDDMMVFRMAWDGTE